jgi:hypothetical protein
MRDSSLDSSNKFAETAVFRRPQQFDVAAQDEYRMDSGIFSSDRV